MLLFVQIFWYGKVLFAPASLYSEVNFARERADAGGLTSDSPGIAIDLGGLYSEPQVLDIP